MGDTGSQKDARGQDEPRADRAPCREEQDQSQAQIRTTGVSREHPQPICLGRSRVAKNIKGPGIFLAQFAGDEPPFNSLDSICQWAASLGYKGVQIASWDPRIFDLK